MFNFEKPSMAHLECITASDAPWYQSHALPRDRSIKFYADVFRAITYPATAGRAVSLAIARVAFAKRTLFAEFCDALQKDADFGAYLAQSGLALPSQPYDMDKWIEHTRATLTKQAADGPEGKLVLEARRRSGFAFSQLKNFVSRDQLTALQAYEEDPPHTSLATVAPRQPERMYAPPPPSSSSNSDGIVSPHLKVAGFHNNVLLLTHFRTCAQDLAFARDKQATDCPHFRALKQLNKIVIDLYTAYGVFELDEAVRDAEKARGTFNQQLGAAVEDELFSLETVPTPLDVQKFIGLFLLSVPRQPTDWSVTHFGRVPGVARQGPTTSPFVHPPAKEVQAWCDWLRECQQDFTSTRIEACRSSRTPCLVLLKGVRYYNGRVQMGEFDLVLMDAVTRQVLQIGEIKASATDLIGARKQRERLVELLAKEKNRVQQCIAQNRSPAPTETEGLTFLVCGGPALATLDPACFEYFSEYPVYRWIMITYDSLTPSSGRAPGRISWKLIREVGLALGFNAERDPAELDSSEVLLHQSIDRTVGNEAFVAAVTWSMRQAWIMILKKEHFQSPRDLIRESQAIDFCNLLLIARPPQRSVTEA